MIHRHKAILLLFGICALSLAAGHSGAQAQQAPPSTAQTHALIAELSDAFESAAKPGRPGEERGATAEKLGLTVQTLTSDIARQLGYGDDKGVLVTDVTPGGAGDDADLKAGDLIKEVNRVRIMTAQDFEKIVRAAKSGDTLALLVRRGQGSFFVAVKVP